MLFAKDYLDSQLPYKKSDKIQMFKVVLSAVFLALAIFMFLLGQETLIGVLVLFVGIAWNLYTPLNNFYGLVLSVIMGVMYAIMCYGLGLVANAFLYLVYYVPMQFVACQNRGDTFILQNKTLNKSQSLFVLVYYVLFFVGIYVFSKSIGNGWVCLLDSASATLLAVSAFARNQRIKGYYKIRLIALGVSIFMWALIVSGSALYPGAVSALLMYVLYFIYDAVMYFYEKNSYNSVELEETEAKKEELAKQRAQKKKMEYEKLQKQNKAEW